MARNNKSLPGFDFAGSMFGSANSVPAQGGGKPKQGEQTGPQNVSAPSPLGWGGIPAALYQNAGGTLGGVNLGGIFPGGLGGGLGIGIGGGYFGVGANGNWIQPRKGNFGTYRLMGLDPTIRLVKSFIYTPIRANKWTVVAADNVLVSETSKKFDIDPITGRVKSVPKSAIDFIRDQIIPLRNGLVQEALRYLEFGCRQFERVYELRNGGPNEGKQYVLKKVKSLIPEWTGILHDTHGNFGGLTTSGGTLAPNKSWICTNDNEAGNLWGLSRNEPAYDPWCYTQQTWREKFLLMGKLSGVLPTLYYRPGTTVINGEEVDNFGIGKQIISTVFAGGAALVPTTQYTDSELQENPELAANAPWKLVIENAGTYAPAMDGMIRENEYQDKLKVRGWGWPERAVLEATTAGSRADSEQHTSSVSADLKTIDDDIAAQVSQGQPMYDVPGLTDELLRLNYGEGTQGSIVVKPEPLEDDQIGVYTSLLNSIFNNPKLAGTAMKMVDWTKVMAHLDIDTPDDLEKQMPAILKAAEAATAQPDPKQPGGAKPSRMVAGASFPAGGNGKAGDN